MKKLAAILISAVSLSLLGGCSSISSAVQGVNESINPWYSGNEIDAIGLKVNRSAALRHAVSVDLVFAYDDNLVTLLTSATAELWFAERNGYIASYGMNMDVMRREIVPGYSELIRDNLPARLSEAKAVFAFAYFPSNPNAKAVITEVATPWLIFDAGQMTLLAQAPGSEPQGEQE